MEVENWPGLIAFFWVMGSIFATIVFFAPDVFDDTELSGPEVFAVIIFWPVVCAVLLVKGAVRLCGRIFK